jgi:hypothetical protein
MATFALDMSANVTGRLSTIISRSDFVFLLGGVGSSLLDTIMSSSETAEKGRGVAMGYLKPATARASARFEADFLTTDDTAIEDTVLEIALGADVNRQRIMTAFVKKRTWSEQKKMGRDKVF